ncbi:hypothetical protein [Bifidobacterium aquikefiri]|uniref:hypothetical protein n=1 Tax=Bifidobacterium aquikefiri TaxID=1653207 RepID=UPI0039E939BA
MSETRTHIRTATYTMTRLLYIESSLSLLMTKAGFPENEETEQVLDELLAANPKELDGLSVRLSQYDSSSGNFVVYASVSIKVDWKEHDLQMIVNGDELEVTDEQIKESGGELFSAAVRIPLERLMDRKQQWENQGIRYQVSLHYHFSQSLLDNTERIQEIQRRLGLVKGPKIPSDLKIESVTDQLTSEMRYEWGSRSGSQ